MLAAPSLQSHRLFEKRRRSRTIVDHRTKFRVTLTMDGVVVAAELRDLSPDGVGLLVPTRSLRALPERHQEVSVILSYDCAQPVSAEFQARVRNVRVLAHRSKNPMVRLGLSFEFPSQTIRPDDHRTVRRYRPPRFFGIHVYCEQPFSLGGMAHFVAEDISARGLAVVTQERNALYLPGLVLKTRIDLPTAGSHELRTVVRSVVENGRDGTLRLGVEFFDPKPDFLEAVKSYLLNSGTCCDAKSVRQAGFAAASVDLPVTVRYASSVRDLEIMQEIRSKTSLPDWPWHEEIGRHLEDNDLSTIQTRFLLIQHGTRCVAAGAIALVREENRDEVTLPLPFRKGGALVLLGGACLQGFRKRQFARDSLQSIVMSAQEAGVEQILVPLSPKILPAIRRALAALLPGAEIWTEGETLGIVVPKR